MASYRGHLMFSSLLGGVYGSAAIIYWDADWGKALLGAGLTTIGGLLPDLDSDSGVPVRELFGAAACIVPFFLFRRFQRLGLPEEQTLVLLGGLYLFIRYILSAIFKRWTVHRGMFHSLPAMLIAGLVVFLGYTSPDRNLRVYLAGGVMLGFFSHLILDEIYSVDFMGMTLRLNKYAGSAVKLFSPSWPATLTCYTILGVLLYLGWQEWPGLGSLPQKAPVLETRQLP
jgi:membrane-bound metal-dependent hydrolase YbcI (DUF457 family)